VWRYDTGVEYRLFNGVCNKTTIFQGDMPEPFPWVAPQVHHTVSHGVHSWSSQLTATMHVAYVAETSKTNSSLLLPLSVNLTTHCGLVVTQHWSHWNVGPVHASIFAPLC